MSVVHTSRLRIEKHEGPHRTWLVGSEAAEDLQQAAGMGLEVGDDVRAAGPTGDNRDQSGKSISFIK